MQCSECSCQSAPASPAAAAQVEAAQQQGAWRVGEQQTKTAAELARIKGKAKLLKIQEAPPELDQEAAPAPVEIDDLTCPICLEQMKLADTAIIKGCEHCYCTACILSWKVVKEQAGCPQCKAPFSTLFTYRSLDGTLRDFPQEESVCLLARAQWFAAHAKEAEKGRLAMAEVLGQQPHGGSGRAGDGAWDDYGRYFDEYDDDEEVENFYFSAAAGRARIVLGNRRWGENGYVSAGRQHARPRVTQVTSKGGKGKASSASRGKAAAAAAAAASPAPAQPAPVRPLPAQHRTPSAPRSIPTPQNWPEATPATRASEHGEQGASPSTPPGSMGQQKRGCRGSRQAAQGEAVCGTSPGSDCGGSSSQGRRARRAAKKAAADARVQAAIPGM